MASSRVYSAGKRTCYQVSGIRYQVSGIRYQFRELCEQLPGEASGREALGEQFIERDQGRSF
jgi:hypothetical protein